MTLVGESKRSKKNNARHYVVISVLALLLLITLVIVGVLLTKKTKLSDLEDTKNHVSRHVVLPNAEEPALLTVTDKSKISSIFAGSAENGDRILIYQNAKKAILYRPSLDRVVDITPVSIGAAQ